MEMQCKDIVNHIKLHNFDKHFGDDDTIMFAWI